MLTKILKVSQQGQVTIPKAWRKSLKLTKNSKVLAYLDEQGTQKNIHLSLSASDWVETIAGSGKGLWGENSQQYLENERDSWK